MTRKLFLFSALPLIALLIFSCKKKSVEEEAQVTFKTYEMKESRHLKGDEKNPLLNISLNMQFPDTFSNVPVLNKIRKTVLSDFFPDIDKEIVDPKIAMATYIKGYIKFYESSEDFTTNNSDVEDEEIKSEDKWWKNEKMSIRHNSENILSYTVETDQFTGGAHGGRSFVNTVINLKTGDRITEDDLFSEESRPKIVDLIVKRLMLKNNVQKAKELEEIGFFDVADIQLNKNFYVNKEGITYTYNEYDIAGYALGTIEILLSYQDISGFMIPGNPLVPLIL